MSYEGDDDGTGGEDMQGQANINRKNTINRIIYYQ